MQHGQVLSQSFRHVRFIGMDAFNLGGLQDQLRQLFTVPVVITNDDMVDNLREGAARQSRESCSASFASSASITATSSALRDAARAGSVCRRSSNPYRIDGTGRSARDGQRQLA